jgi:hypothetical protein
MCIREERNMGKCTGVWKIWRRYGDGRNMRRCIIPSSVSSTSYTLNPTNSTNLLAVSVYVAYRSHDTDEYTAKDVLKDLKGKNTEVRQWVEFQEDK